MTTLPTALKSDLERLAKKIDPGSLLLVADGETALALPRAADIHRCTAEQARRARADRRQYDLGIFIDDSTSLDKREKEPLISALRDVTTRRFVLALPPQAASEHAHWSNAELIAFGLTELEEYEGGWRLFEYNILNYKQTPDWLNPRNWANPEMWGKYRW